MNIYKANYKKAKSTFRFYQKQTCLNSLLIRNGEGLFKLNKSPEGKIYKALFSEMYKALQLYKANK